MLEKIIYMICFTIKREQYKKHPSSAVFVPFLGCRPIWAKLAMWWPPLPVTEPPGAEPLAIAAQLSPWFANGNSLNQS